MKRLPRQCVVDTNVAVVANGKSDQADDSLTEACVDALLEITRRGGLVLDDGDRIFEEYRHNLNLSGEPRAGDAFMKWVHDHRWNAEWCEMRTITPDKDEQTFKEFPKSPALADFDPSDRKFVATANAGQKKHPILQAVDFKWWGWKDALAKARIKVVFLDEAAAEAGYKKHACQ
jgi:hypothetical protein